jgi:hypothetical protein
MRGPPIPINDPFMWRLVALVNEQLPNLTHQVRLSLLARLHALEQEAEKNDAHPSTLRSIRATYDFVRRCARMRNST